jgi:hypothetical protein
LRGRDIREFKSEVVILKDFQDSRIEVKVQGRQGEGFNLAIYARDKESQRPLRNVRVTLYTGELEFESKVSEDGRVVFEHVSAGPHSIEVMGFKKKLAWISLEVRV